MKSSSRQKSHRGKLEHANISNKAILTQILTEVKGNQKAFFLQLLYEINKVNMTGYQCFLFLIFYSEFCSVKQALHQHCNDLWL